MSDHLPEGVEVTYTIYITSDSTELNAAVKINMRRNLEFKKEIKPTELLSSFGHNISDAADDWRFMTRDEIAQYKLEEEEN